MNIAKILQFIEERLSINWSAIGPGSRELFRDQLTDVLFEEISPPASTNGLAITDKERQWLSLIRKEIGERSREPGDLWDQAFRTLNRIVELAPARLLTDEDVGTLASLVVALEGKRGMTKDLASKAIPLLTKFVHGSTAVTLPELIDQEDQEDEEQFILDVMRTLQLKGYSKTEDNYDDLRRALREIPDKATVTSLREVRQASDKVNVTHNQDYADLRAALDLLEEARQEQVLMVAFLTRDKSSMDRIGKTIDSLIRRGVDFSAEIAAWQLEQKVERRAIEIYEDMPFEGPGTKPRWTTGGNGFKQTEARRLAREELRK